MFTIQFDFTNQVTYLRNRESGSFGLIKCSAQPRRQWFVVEESNRRRVEWFVLFQRIQGYPKNIIVRRLQCSGDWWISIIYIYIYLFLVFLSQSLGLMSQGCSLIWKRQDMKCSLGYPQSTLWSAISEFLTIYDKQSRIFLTRIYNVICYKLIE